MVAPVNVGDVLAEKYQVERVLGEGGMGVVVAARHLRLGERVAIKFLLPQALSRADLVGRFLREGQAAARIRSEHVTRVYDVGTLAGGEPYLVMEYLEGIDLKAVLHRDGTLPVELACEHLLQVCEALAEAHALGIIHRDLKPGNLFLSQRADGSPLLKVIDFGISKMALEAEPTLPKGHDVTESSAMLGSPLYMAPEQMVSSKNVDARADIWSMGAILFQLLTGLTPFRGDSVMEIYDRILEGPPRLRALRADVPVRLEHAVQRCLQKNPADRFSNIAELAAELAAFAPPHAQILAERAARVLRVRPQSSAGGSVAPAAPRRSLPSSTERAASSSGGSPNAQGVPAASGWGGAPAALLADGAVTDRSWGGTRASPGQGRTGARAFGIAAGVALALLASGGFVWLVFRAVAPVASSGADAATPAAPEAPPPGDTAKEAPLPAQVAPAVGPAAGETAELLDGGPAPAASATAAPAASAPAAPAASPTAAPAASATAPGPRSPGPARPSTSGRVRPPPVRDPFADPR
ncbi:protein kinase [Sorangium cellulosum]|uniref:Protein kinase n=1 Tax=Sorangium cellulosum TaxID=56 RepID=A0A2L0EZU8_SORCE|nr:serine/threonine-protein kinase [Sorangium cellulosum]AUX44810.1 protein kinase [Sorangium cellulosum]